MKRTRYFNVDSNEIITEELMTTKEVAGFLCYSYIYIWRLTKQGRIPYVDIKVGKGKKPLRRFRCRVIEKIAQDLRNGAHLKKKGDQSEW